MKPEVSEIINGYIFNWPDEHLSIKVSRLSVHKDGRVTGEILITTDAEDFKSPILHPPTQINFTADRTRKELAKTLSEKYSDQQWDWIAIIDQLSFKIQELAREGEPVKEIWTYEDAPPLEYLLEPILIRGMPTVIFGEKGSTKSRLAIIVATCLLLPWHDNPLELVVPERSIKALILDWETEWDIVRYEVKRLQLGMSLPDFPVFYRRCNLPLADDIEQIQQHIEKVKAEVLIIDSLGAAAGGELNKPEIALNFFSALRRLKRTSLIIAQTSKSEEGKKSIFGSTYFTYYARSIFELCKGEDIGGDDIHVALFHRWCNISKTHQPIGFNFHFEDNWVTVEREPVSIREFLAKIGTQQQIMELIKAGPLSTKEIMESLGISRANADKTLQRLRTKNKIVKVEDKWGLLHPLFNRKCRTSDI